MDMPNNVNADTLGDHWKSALCVTSLYDSYVAVQHENESLKEQLRSALHAKELLAVEAAQITKKKTSTRPENGGEEQEGGEHASQLVQEIRLLRAEKSQQELLFDKRRAQLESELNEYKALYKDQQLKYQQKFDLDPMEPQRVALSTRTLQDALDNVVREKEELVLQHRQLQQLYHKLDQQNKHTTALLEAQLTELQSKRIAQATHRVHAVLDKWVLTKISHSWKQWRLVVLTERLQSQQKHEQLVYKTQVETQQRNQIQERAAKMVIKLLQSTARRCFSGWRQRVQDKKGQRQQLQQFHQQRHTQLCRSVFIRWKCEYKRRQSCSEGLFRLATLVERHGKRRAWRAWVTMPLAVEVGGLRRRNHELETAITAIQTQVDQLQSECEELKCERDERMRQIQEDTTQYQQQVESLTHRHETYRDRIGELLSCRRQRLFLDASFRVWREEVATKRMLKHKITQFAHHYAHKKVRQSVRQWATTAHDQQRVRQITTKFVQRMRMVGVYRCLLAWREFAAGEKERTATIQRVVHRMKNQKLIQSFTCWKAFHQHHHRRRQQLTSMCSNLEKLSTKSYFTHWRKASVALSTAVEQAKRQQIEREWRQRLEQSKFELKQLRVCFGTWQSRTKKDQKFRQLTTKVAIKWKNGTQGKCMDAWKELVVRRRTAREILRRLAMRRVARELASAWTRWRTHTLVETKTLELLDVERERGLQIQQLEMEVEKLRLAEVALQASSAEREQTLTLELCATRQALAGLQSSCVQYKGCLKAACLSMSQRRTLATYLRLWKHTVAQTKKHQQIVIHTRTTTEMRNLRRVFAVWNAQRCKRLRLQAMVKSLQVQWRGYVALDVFRGWQLYARQRSSIRRLTSVFTHTSHQRLSRLVLVAWRVETRKTRLLRKTLEQIWLTSVHFHLKESFTKWSEIAKDATIHDQRTRHEQALAAIQAKVCGKWTACSLKAVFAAWRQGVANQKSALLGEQRLQRLHHWRLLTITFGEWKTMRNQIHRQREWLQKWQNKQECEAKSCAVEQWKTLVVATRREEVAMLETTRQQQEQELKLERERIADLVCEKLEIQSQLKTLEARQSLLEALNERLGQRAAMSKWFHQWRMDVRISTTRRAHLRRFQLNQTVRLQRNVLQSWWGSVLARRQQAQQAIQRGHQRSLQQLRGVCCAWRSFTQRHTLMRRQLRRLQERRQRHQRRIALETWKTAMIRTQATRRLMEILTRWTTKATLVNGFALWRQTTRQLTQRTALENEKKKRVMALLVERDEYTLSTCFAGWKAKAVVRSQRMQIVRRREELHRKRRLAELLQKWRQQIKHSQNQVEQTSRLMELYERQRLRVGLRHWMSQVTKSRLEELATDKQRLVQNYEELQTELDQKKSQVDQLTTSVTTLEHAQQQLQQEMKSSVTQAETLWTMEHRQRVLTKLVLRQQHVPQSSVALKTAFHQWKTRSEMISRQCGALRRCSRLVLRKLQTRLFCAWRRRVATATKLELLTQRTVTKQSRVAWIAWRGFVDDRATQRRRLIVRWIDATHTLQTQAVLSQKTAMAFRIWKLQTTLASTSERLALVSQAQENDNQGSRTQQRRQQLLSKWCWRAYYGRRTDLRAAMGRWRSVVCETTKTEELRKKIQELQNETVKSSTPLDATTIARLTQSLQSLFRRLSAVQSANELFDAVALVIPQLLHRNVSAVLYLLDPTTNELWTHRRESQQLVRVPSSLGIAGCSLSSLSTVLIQNASRDPRFHPLVDQLVVSSITGSYSHYQQPSEMTGVTLFSTAIVASDSTAYGVLQIAFQAEESRTIATDVQLLGRVSGFFVEQLLYEMVRHCRDRLRCRAPDNFAKLFKQNRNWRKYFVQVEREAQKTQQQLTQLLEEQEFLVQEKTRLQHAMDQAETDRRALVQAQEQAVQQGQSQELLMKHLVAFKKKTTKLKELVHQKEELLVAKAQELARIQDELTRLQQDVRAKEWQAMFSAKATAAASPRNKQHKAMRRLDEESEELYPRDPRGVANCDLLKGAEVATLKNQLVRAESDSMLLVKAVDVATRHRGELPETLKTEVMRIASRLKRLKD